MRNTAYGALAVPFSAIICNLQSLAISYELELIIELLPWVLAFPNIEQFPPISASFLVECYVSASLDRHSLAETFRSTSITHITLELTVRHGGQETSM